MALLREIRVDIAPRGDERALRKADRESGAPRAGNGAGPDHLKPHFMPHAVPVNSLIDTQAQTLPEDSGARVLVLPGAGVRSRAMAGVLPEDRAVSRPRPEPRVLLLREDWPEDRAITPASQAPSLAPSIAPQPAQAAAPPPVHASASAAPLPDAPLSTGGIASTGAPPDASPMDEVAAPAPLVDTAIAIEADLAPRAPLPARRFAYNAERARHAPVGASPAGDPNDAGDAPTPRKRVLRAYKRSVRAHLEARKPAGRYGSGRLVVGFTLSRSGQVVSARIVKSSGKTDMDKSAVQAVYSSAPFPRPPRGVKPSDRRFAIPFRFD